MCIIDDVALHQASMDDIPRALVVVLFFFFFFLFLFRLCLCICFRLCSVLVQATLAVGIF